MQVYIEDPTATDLAIEGATYRKPGTLKNSETVPFEIGDGAAKVYVIADRQKGKNVGFIVLAIAIVVGFIFGFGIGLL